MSSYSKLKEALFAEKGGAGYQNFKDRRTVRHVNYIPGKSINLRIIAGTDEDLTPFVSRVHFDLFRLWPKTPVKAMNCMADDQGEGCAICDRIQSVRAKKSELIQAKIDFKDPRVQALSDVIYKCDATKYWWQVLDLSKNDGQVYILEATKPIAIEIFERAEMEGSDGEKYGLGGFIFSIKKTQKGAGKGKIEYSFSFEAEAKTTLEEEIAKLEGVTDDLGGFYNFAQCYGHICKTSEEMKQRLEGTYVKKTNRVAPDEEEWQENVIDQVEEKLTKPKVTLPTGNKSPSKPAPAKAPVQTQTKPKVTVQTKGALPKGPPPKKEATEDLIDEIESGEIGDDLDLTGTSGPDDSDNLFDGIDIEEDEIITEEPIFDVTFDEIKAVKRVSEAEAIYSRFPEEFQKKHGAFQKDAKWVKALILAMTEYVQNPPKEEVPFEVDDDVIDMDDLLV